MRNARAKERAARECSAQKREGIVTHTHTYKLAYLSHKMLLTIRTWRFSAASPAAYLALAAAAAAAAAVADGLLGGQALVHG